MSYREEGGGRTGDFGTPADEGNGVCFDNSDIALRDRSEAPSFDPLQLERYRGAGHELIPLHGPEALDRHGRSIGKAPLRKGWRSEAALSVDEALDHLAGLRNVGVRLRPTDLVVDVDPRNFAEGDDPLGRLQGDLGIDLDAWMYPRVVTGSGGLHIYMRLAEPAELLGSLEEYPGVEFKAYGRQVVAAGSVHPEGGVYAWDEDPLSPGLMDTSLAPDALVERITRRARPSQGKAGDIEPDQLADMLAGLDPTAYADHDKWLQLMMACHHATTGSGRDEFIEWSTGDPRYSNDAWIIGRRWDSLHADESGRRVTQRTLFKALIDAGKQDLIPRPSAEEDFADLTDEDLQAPSGEHASPEKARKPLSLTDEWVWIAEIERFVRKSDNTKYNERQFKSMFQNRWPGGDICSAVWKGELPIRRVEALAYVPSQPPFIAEGEWAGRYNLWRPSGVSAKPGEVSVFLRHMDYLFPDETEQGHVLDYLSLLVSEPFVKVHFALLVQGKQGTGKSFLGKLMRAMIGDRNVSMPGSSEVAKEYTGWQEGVQLAILEEMMALGRKEVANRLKPAITDDYLRIRHLYMNPYSLPNFLNLLCFTNHDDALPIEAGDRRWLVAFSDAEPRDESYYSELFGLLDGDGPAAVKHFLQQRMIGLNPKGVAPSTRGKAEMRRLSLSEAEQYLTELLEESAPPFDFDLIRLDDLVEAVPVEYRRQTKGLRPKLARWLRDEVGARATKRYTKQDGSGRPSFQLWSIRDHEEWERAGAAGRVDAYLKHSKL